MARGKKWAIWSLDNRSGRWVEVDSDLAEEEAEAAVRRRTETGQRLGIPAEYVALPKGQVPEPRAPMDAREAVHQEQGGVPVKDLLEEPMIALAKLSALFNTLRITRSNDPFVMEIVDKSDEVFAPFLAKNQGGL